MIQATNLEDKYSQSDSKDSLLTSRFASRHRLHVIIVQTESGNNITPNGSNHVNDGLTMYTRCARTGASVCVEPYPETPNVKRAADLWEFNNDRGLPQPSLPRQLRCQTLFRFDTQRFPFAELVREVLETLVRPDLFSERLDLGEAEALAEGVRRVLPGLAGPPGAEVEDSKEPRAETLLSKLHFTREGRFMIRSPPRSGHDPFRRSWFGAVKHPQFKQRIRSLLEDFVQEIVTPLMQVESGTQDLKAGGEVIYQIEPSIRFHLPGVKALGIPHRDCDYFHQPGEINFWWPLSSEAFGSNSLFCEGLCEDLGDDLGNGVYRAFQCKYGEGIRFYGNQLSHFTVLNETQSTRVSLDIRCIRKQDYSDTWKNSVGKVPFRIGGYYAVTGSADAET